ncbi:MAG: hypothetical protein J3R72DRAFT_67968 [Linnemannia gamsii]|nr:MAG: hypothetical protein J3R72DRAFT_67968 [Linnemannia gamsii]
MNTIHPSQKAHSVMSSGKDVAPAMGADRTDRAERVLKRPSSSSSSSSSHGQPVRQDHQHSQPYNNNYGLHHNHSHQQQRQQHKDNTVNSSSTGNYSHSLHSSLSLPRQTWTHSAFTRLTSESESNGSREQHPHQQQHSPHKQQQQQTHASRLSLAGVCTVRIGPHLFLDTKFYTVLCSPSPMDSISSTARSTRPNLALKQEPLAAQYQQQQQQQQHRVAMEFKENPGKIWLFPYEASVDFSPANDRDSAQISASFHLSNPETTQKSERTNRSSPSQAISMTIMQATPALWEGLEQAVTGPHTMVTRPPAAKPKSGSSRPHIPSTHSEDTSEILGSGKAAKQPSPSNGTTAKRQQDKAADNSSKASKPKQPKDQDDKGRAASTKGTSGPGGSKKAATAGSASNPSQKRCGYCDCTTTPMWRRGPNGPSTLCNACGVKWKHGKIMQDVTEGQAVSTSGQGSGATPSAPRPSSTSKSSKDSQENGYSRQAEAKRATNKTGQSGSSSGSKSNHDPARGGSSSPKEKSNTKDIHNAGRRGSDAEKIVPVKKRHIASSVSPPGGPRMVPIHELDDLIRPASNNSPTNRKKHGYDDDGDDSACGPNGNGKIRQRKNGAVHSHQTNESQSASLSTRSSKNDEALSHQSPPSADEGLSLYSTKNLYTNNTATFPLHFPTISIGFGPNNAYYTYPNCAMILFENHFQIKLMQGGERTEIDVWKEGIEGTEFQVVDVGDGESMIVMKALLRQYLTRFDKELLNPDRNESLIVFRFRERLDGGGPSVKPLLEHWLATDIPVPPAHPSQDVF